MERGAGTIGVLSHFPATTGCAAVTFVCEGGREAPALPGHHTAVPAPGQRAPGSGRKFIPGAVVNSGPATVSGVRRPAAYP